MDDVKIFYAAMAGPKERPRVRILEANISFKVVDFNPTRFYWTVQRD